MKGDRVKYLQEMGKELLVKHDTKYTNKKLHFSFHISKLITVILQTLIWGEGSEYIKLLDHYWLLPYYNCRCPFRAGLFFGVRSWISYIKYDLCARANKFRNQESEVWIIHSNLHPSIVFSISVLPEKLWISIWGKDGSRKKGNQWRK